jgi:hypothetical protein
MNELVSETYSCYSREATITPDYWMGYLRYRIEFLRLGKKVTTRTKRVVTTKHEARKLAREWTS